MKTNLLLAVLCSLFFVGGAFAQENSALQKHALVIGNGAYTNLSRLTNPVNDAADVAAVLQYLGFTVDVVLDGSLEQMEDAVVKLRDRLMVRRKTFL